MSADGKKALLDAVAGGKGFVGCHCASDTFHSKGDGGRDAAARQSRPIHRHARRRVHRPRRPAEGAIEIVDPKWPGLKDAKDLDIMEEWYALKNFAPDLHVILVMDTKDMKGDMYQRPPYPETWARKHEKGRVFFTSLGHREDVWESEFFQNLLLGRPGVGAGQRRRRRDAEHRQGDAPRRTTCRRRRKPVKSEVSPTVSPTRKRGISSKPSLARRANRPKPQGEYFHESTLVQRSGAVDPGRLFQHGG